MRERAFVSFVGTCLTDTPHRWKIRGASAETIRRAFVLVTLEYIYYVSRLRLANVNASTSYDFSNLRIDTTHTRYRVERNYTTDAIYTTYVTRGEKKKKKERE